MRWCPALNPPLPGWPDDCALTEMKLLCGLSRITVQANTYLECQIHVHAYYPPTKKHVREQE